MFDFTDIINRLLQMKQATQQERADLDAKEARIDRMLADAGYEPVVAEAVEPAKQEPILDVDKLKAGLAVY